MVKQKSYKIRHFWSFPTTYKWNIRLKNPPSQRSHGRWRRTSTSSFHSAGLSRALALVRPFSMEGWERERERGRERFGYSLLVDQMVGRDVGRHVKHNYLADVLGKVLEWQAYKTRCVNLWALFPVSVSSTQPESQICRELQQQLILTAMFRPAILVTHCRRRDR